MLSIQPNFSTTTQYSARPAFKGGWDKESIAEERNFYERQRQELDDLIADDYVPEKIKKPFKFFRMAANAAISGLAVFGSALAIAGFFKKAGAKVANNSAAQKASENVIKPIGAKIVNVAKKISNKLLSVLNAVKTTTFGEKAAKFYDKFEKTPVGEKVVDITKKAAKTAKKAAKKVVSPIKNATYDGTAKATATVLGAGSGLAGGYEEYMKASPVETIEEEV